ncbi:MAG: universal stress protein [Dehalococcoidales bacterium]
MYKHIMVPLDGSELAECVLPHLEMIARECQGAPQITLIRIVTPLKLYGGFEFGGVPEYISPEQIQRLEDNARNSAQLYLAGQVKRLQADGIDAEAKVVFGLASESLTDYAEKNGVDLIVIATHGRSGIREWFWGSVAERVLKTSKIPILMVRPDGCSIKK